MLDARESAVVRDFSIRLLYGVAALEENDKSRRKSLEDSARKAYDRLEGPMFGGNCTNPPSLPYLLFDQLMLDRGYVTAVSKRLNEALDGNLPPEEVDGVKKDVYHLTDRLDF